MLRLVLGVLASRRSQAVTLAVLAVLAVAAGTAAPLYATAADRAAVAAELRAATPIERAITFTADVAATDGHAAGLDTLRGQAREKVGDHGLSEVLGVSVPGTATVGGTATGGTATGADATAGNPVQAPVTTRTGVCAHLVIDGACPAAAGEVVLSEPTAKRLAAANGTELTFRPDRAEQPVTLRVVGVYDPAAALAAGDPYWAGRDDLTPQPLRFGNPMFTAESTIDTLGVGAVRATVDLIADDAAFAAGDVDRLAGALPTAIGIPGTLVSNGLPRLLRRVQDSRDVLGLAAPLGAAQLLVVCWFVLLMAVGYTAAERRGELALGLLRGVPPRHRALLALGPTALVLLVAAPFGVLFGWLMVRLLTWATFARTQEIALDRTALLAGAGTLLVVMASAAIAERRAHTGSLVEALRQVPTRRRGRIGLTELAVGVVALAAIGQSLASDSQAGGLPLLVPLLLAIVVGLLTARLVRRAAIAYGASRLHRGRLAPALAALQVARRPGADRLVALTVVAVALVGYTVSAWDVAVNTARERAELALGAPRVLTVFAASRPALLDGVRRADPEGAWAMAVTRQEQTDRTLLGVDSARLAAVVGDGTPGGAGPAAEIGPLLRAPAGEPVTVAGAALELDVDVVTAELNPMTVTVALTGPRGEPVTGRLAIPMTPGRAKHRVELPECAVAPGCRLYWLSFPHSLESLHLHGLRQLGPDRTLLEGAAIAAAARWRPSFGAEAEVTPIQGPDYITLVYVPSDPKNISTDIRLYVADAPVPLPVVAAGARRLAHTRELRGVEALQGMDRPVDLRRVYPALPGMAREGVVFDLEAADRLSDSRDNGVRLEVWLGGAAPADAVDRLRANGLVPVGDQTAGTLADRYREQGAGLALRLHLAAALLSVLLVALATMVLAATDRRNRAAELVALRLQGMPASVAARSARIGNLAMILIAAPVGALTALAAWALSEPARTMLTSAGDLPPPGPDPLVVVPAVLAATGVLVAAALLAGRSLVRVTGEGASARTAGNGTGAGTAQDAAVAARSEKQEVAR
ncbi:FtsX-like permease family protein [Catellatospora sp. NPDC049609]|uniref:FtsX-like permease family protein n=1 Tax=Catellatospora sp. NPDC049609 TaxID=3155505 RepID=UPI00341ACC4F